MKDCEAFFIRKKNWHNIICNDDSRDIIPLLEDSLKHKYETILELYLNKLKEEDLKIIQTRNGPAGVI